MLLLPELQPDQPSSKTAAAHEGGREGRRPWQPYKVNVVEEVSGYSGGEDGDFEEVAAVSVPEELEAATHAAMAAFSASQAKLRALKQARGYFQKTEPSVQPDRRDRLRKLMQENPRRGCGQYGHWSKDPECPKNAKSSSASLVTTPAQSSVPSPEQQAEHAAMSAVLEQMMRDQQQATPRAYMAAMTSWEGSTSFSSGDFVTLVNTSDDLLAARMVVDLGCLRTVAGVKWVVQEIARCRAQGRFVEIRKTLDYFRFGDGERRPSHYRVFLEVGLAQHVGLLAINAVEYPCPPLLSKVVCSALGLQLDCGSGRFDLTKIGVRGQHFTTSQEGHFLLSIDHFHPAWPQWQQLLTAGHIPKIQREEIQCFELRSGEPVGRGARRARPHSSHVAVRTTVHPPSPSRPAPSIHGGATSACSSGGGNSPDCVADRWGGRVGVRAIAASEDSPWHPPGREHGETSHGQGLCNYSPGQEDQGLSGSGIDSGGRDRPEEPQEGVNQILVQEGADAGSDGAQCRNAEFPTLGMTLSGDAVFNMSWVIHGRLIVHKWKQLVWMVRARDALEAEGRRYKRHPRWLAMMFSRETAALWGHLGGAVKTLQGPRGPPLMK